MKKVKINKMGILVLFACIVTAFSFLKSSAVSSQKNEVRTNPNKEYQITYELNGGRFEGEYPKTFKISQETTIPNPIKEGSEFLGWTINNKTDVSPVKDYKIPSMTKEDLKLTANWKSRGSILIRGDKFKEILEKMFGFYKVEEIQFIYGTPNPNGTDVSQAQDKSIMANIEGTVLTVACEGEIMANPDCSSMFYLFGADIDIYHCPNKVLKKITFENFNTNQVTNMQYMFWNCEKLQSLNLNDFNTNKLVYMNSMFAGCKNLTEIKGIENFNTSKVISMYETFPHCKKLSGEITISNPNTSSYTSMFRDCSTEPSAKFIVKYVSPETKEVARQMVKTKLAGNNVFLYEPPTLVDGQTFNNIISGINGFKNVEEIRFIYGTPNPNGTDVSQAQDKSIMANIEGTILTVACEDEIMANPDSSYMFSKYGCQSYGTNKVLNKIMFDNFNTNQVINMDHIFYRCSMLTSLDLSKWDTSNVTNMDMMFYYCYNLKNLNLNNFDTSNVGDMSEMFHTCYALNGEITITNSNIHTNTYRMFEDCSIDKDAIFIVKYISPETKEVAKQMVNTKTSRSNVYLYDPTPNLIDGETFRTKIKSIPNFTDVTEIQFVKEKPQKNGIDLSTGSSGNIIANIEGNILTIASEGEIMANSNCYNMFYNLSNINYIYLNNFNTSQITDMVGMFSGCISLKSLDVSNFDTSQVTQMNHLFSGCSSLTEIKGLENFKTNKSENLNNMFSGCSLLINLDLSSFNFANAKSLHEMFNNCYSLTSIKGLDKWDMNNIGNYKNMFNNCKNLSGEITIKVSNLSPEYYLGMFYNCSIEPSSKFVVNYTSGCKSLAQNMVNTKENGNVVLGTQKSLLNEDIQNKEEASVPDTVTLTIKDGNTATKKEILAGEIGSLNTPSKEGMIFSGYFYDKEFTKLVSERDVISEDTTIYIKWEEVPQNEEIPQEESKDESLGEVA